MNLLVEKHYIISLNTILSIILLQLSLQFKFSNSSFSIILYLLDFLKYTIKIYVEESNLEIKVVILDQK